jgi:hypothetical protein
MGMDMDVPQLWIGRRKSFGPHSYRGTLPRLHKPLMVHLICTKTSIPRNTQLEIESNQIVHLRLIEKYIEKYNFFQAYPQLWAHVANSMIEIDLGHPVLVTLANQSPYTLPAMPHIFLQRPNKSNFSLV